MPRFLLAVATCLLALLAPLTAGAARGPTPVVVTDLEAVGTSPTEARSLTAIVGGELARYPALRSLTSSDISGLIGLARQQALVGCTDDACRVGIAQLVGAEELIAGQLGVLDGNRVLTLQRLDVASGRVAARAMRVVRPDGSLIDATRSALAELLQGRAEATNRPPRLALPARVVAHQGERVELDGSRAYDADGDPLQHEWLQLDGPAEALERAADGRAAFTAQEVGLHTFELAVSDGRAAPVRQQVMVEVRPQRRFQLSLGYGQLFAFNRMVERDSAGHAFRNRVVNGFEAQFALLLGDRTALTAALGWSFMHLFPEDGALEWNEAKATGSSLEVDLLRVRVGLRRYVPFDLFRLYGEAGLGPSRMYFTAHDGPVVEENVRGIAAWGRGLLGAEVPLSEFFGLLLEAGAEAQVGTQRIAPFKQGIGFGVARDGFLWGFDWRVAAWARF